MDGLLLAIGFLMFIIGKWWAAWIAIRESALLGVLCLFVPFFILFFAYQRFDITKKPVIIWAVGICLMFVSLTIP